VGIVGAGGIVASSHIPGLRRMPGVEIVAVANRSLESSQRAAAEFGIPRAYASWEALIGADGIDAVLIGTWPWGTRLASQPGVQRLQRAECWGDL
jgi:predicted dehydrogenase